MSEPGEVTIRSQDATPFILGLVAIIVALPFPPAAIVLGGLGLVSARRSSTSAVLARVGLVLGIVLTALGVVAIVLAVVFGLDAFTVLYHQCEVLGQESGRYGPFPYECS
ncbi:MAG: hypothetical protein BGO97_06105 [Micrococcales bacterium 70-64]|nr:hypothetical protein [Leifsonia sp.]OJX85334.1 MAG: hypothetical protein BGO97_06105 [Micrococcales bacterium 70-64]